MAVWTWDATHFTWDDSTYHTWDGWHIDIDVPSQDPNWQTITSAADVWNDTTPTQAPNWVTITSASDAWVEIVPTQSAGYSGEDPSQVPSWTVGSISN